MESSGSSLRAAIRSATFAGEADLVARLVGEAGLDAAGRRAVAARAAGLVREVRRRSSPTVMEAFLAEYGLSTEEGVGLMCLAEALLRVPDPETIDALIADKIEPSNWGAHLGHSTSPLVNAATWGLMLTGRILDDDPGGPAAALRAMVRRLGEPVVRTAVAQAMKLMGRQFVLGESIGAAQVRARVLEAKGYTYSYDMLGEAARTDADARRYVAAYADAIRAIGARATGDVRTSPGISVKLSALHPRYETTHRAAVMAELLPRARDLVRAAASAGIGFNIDAEEADRLDLSLDVIEALMADPHLRGWQGFGVVVQAYGRRAGPVIDWLHDLARRHDRRIMVRLVKGAYWDAEVKLAQERGLPDFPVFTRKPATDVSYIANARKLLDGRDRIYPQFATHNAHTVAAVLALAGPDVASFEFQRLHGMGEALHAAVREEAGTACRIYAPVGAHRDLLAYLVRRLLENGANSSFVNQIVDKSCPPELIAADPLAAVETHLVEGTVANPGLQPPAVLFSPRQNSRGWSVNEPASVAPLLADRVAWRTASWSATPPGGASGRGRAVTSPADPADVVGHVVEAGAADVAAALALAPAGFAHWSGWTRGARAAVLRRAADLYEAHGAELTALATREAGKTLADAIAELREAVDFLRYYADAAEASHGAPRGVMVCISPWNFPLAIFTGQVAACLGAGNAVIAKPAEQTPLIAARATALLHAAGVPAEALQLLPGDGASVGGPLTAAPGIAGVVFTGSTEVARIIHAALVDHAAPDAVLIAETGGLNAMIVDSTALTEQVVRDVVASAFQSAGQRCSALRILYLQDEAHDRTLAMLEGAMDALVVGNPWDTATDVGPVIDAEAEAGIRDYLASRPVGTVLKALPVPDGGRFVPPSVVAVEGIGAVEREVFGPVLHVARFRAADLDRVVDAINARGFGLTFGLHSRIDDRVEAVTARLRVGNAYVNRNQIGAIVGSQPFGGEGLSGTGPKAGGPFYLPRLQRAQLPAGGAAAPEGLVVAGEVLAAALVGLDSRAWAERGDRLGMLEALLRGSPGAAALAVAAEVGPAVRNLPGPTGESNRLSLHPRGRVLALGTGGRAALDQAVLALAAGNGVVVVAQGAEAALAPLLGQGLPLVVIEGQVAPEDLAGAGALDLVAAAGPTDWLRSLRRALARRPGAIVGLVAEPLEAGRYVTERHLCIDTTAAGGNASLLAASA